MKIIVDNIATLYYDAPSNTSREDEDEDPKYCFKIAQNRLCYSLRYTYKYIGRPEVMITVLWSYSHLKSEFIFVSKSN